MYGNNPPVPACCAGYYKYPFLEILVETMLKERR